MEAGQTKLRTDFLGELGQTRDIMGKVAELQDGITGMRDDLTVTFGAAIQSGARTTTR